MTFRIMSAWVRYFFPSVDPYSLSPEEFTTVWREAEFLLKMTKPIQETR